MRPAASGGPVERAALSSNSARVSWIVSGLRAASNISAAVAATHGAAIEEPDLRVSSGAPGSPPEGADRAARLSTPGATISGLTRPSAVGPALLKGPSSRLPVCGLYAPTAIVWRPVHSVPSVVE